MGIIRLVSEFLHKWWTEFTWRRAVSHLVTGLCLLLFALFFDWLIINWLTRCCDGGICIPEWIYPNCKPDAGQP